MRSLRQLKARWRSWRGIGELLLLLLGRLARREGVSLSLPLSLLPFPLSLPIPASRYPLSRFAL